MADLRIVTDAPFADGICFDDTWAMQLKPAAVQTLCARGLVFLTEFEAGGVTWGGKVIASAFDTAREIADARGLGETVTGRMAAIIPVNR
ncbi:MAG: hypothetical protein AB7U38_01815 [Hyphomicrobiales bacterium]